MKNFALVFSRRVPNTPVPTVLVGEAGVVTPDLGGDNILRTILVQIDQNNVRETSRRTLVSSYPVIEQLVGDASFRGLCREYMRRFPSSSGSLQHFGANFLELPADQFVATFQEPTGG